MPPPAPYFLFCFSVFLGLASLAAGATTTGATSVSSASMRGIVTDTITGFWVPCLTALMPAGSGQVAGVQALALDEVRQIDADELGQVRGQALDFQVHADVADQALVGLDRRRVFFAREVQRHLLAQPRRAVDTLEVDVQHHRLVGVHLKVAQQHFLCLAAEFHLEHRRVEGFLLEREEQRVVIEFDHGGRAGSVNDAGHFCSVAQAAARSGPLQRTLVGCEFHVDSDKDGAPATRRLVKQSCDCAGSAAREGRQFLVGRLAVPGHSATNRLRSCCFALRTVRSPIRRR